MNQKPDGPYKEIRQNLDNQTELKSARSGVLLRQSAQI